MLIVCSPRRRLVRGCKRPSRVEVRILNQRQLYLFEICVGKLPEIGCGLRDGRATGAESLITMAYVSTGTLE